MVKSEHKRQQKLARKQAKDRKRHLLEAQKRQQLSSLQGQMIQCAGGKIEYCGLNPIIEKGLGYVGLARRAPDGQLAFAAILVDIYCMGVKQALGNLLSVSKVRGHIENLGLQPIAPGLARGLVESAIEYAQIVGLKPHPDYDKVAPLWGDIPRESIEGHFELGFQGEHLFIPGPMEDKARQFAILATMNEHLGEGRARFSINERQYRIDGVAYEEDVVENLLDYGTTDEIES